MQLIQQTATRREFRRGTAAFRCAGRDLTTTALSGGNDAPTGTRDRRACQVPTLPAEQAEGEASMTQVAGNGALWHIFRHFFRAPLAINHAVGGGFLVRRVGTCPGRVAVPRMITGTPVG